MFNFNDSSISVQMCKFQALIQKAHIVIKFPCSYFVQWKTINNRYSVCTQKRVRTSNDQAVFHQKLTFYTQMVYNSKKRQYYSKETFLLLNLVSKSRPDQVKLVGRVSVDLAQVLNRGRFNQVKRVRMNYCSVEGSIVFGITLLNKRESNLSVKDLDRSAFKDYFSLNPINRMMIEESISSGNFVGHTHTSNSNKLNRQYQQQKQQSRQPPQQERYHPFPVPKFAQINNQQPRTQTKGSSANNNNPPRHQQMDQQVISFQNSQHQEQFIGESPRTNYSREQSLIQKLQQRNLKASEKEYSNQQRYYQKVVNNVVEVQSREAKTQRGRGNENNSVWQQNNNNNTTSVYTIGNRNGGLNKVQEQVQSGQIRRQQTQINKSPSQSKLPSPPTIISKPTSPPSHQPHLTRINSSSKFSQNSQSQQQQLLLIVQKLEHQKLQQQSMIQSLKAMLGNKSIKKKQVSSRTGQNVQQADQKHHQQIIDENTALRNENDSLLNQLFKKSQQLHQKNMHVFQLLDKIKKLQSQLTKHDQKIKLYQDEIAEFQMKEIQNQKVCESLKLSLTMQPGYENLVKGKGDGQRNNRMEVNVNQEKEDEEIAMLTQKSSKLLDCSKTNQLQTHVPPNELQSHQRLSRSQQQPQQQQFKITITKDQRIYQQLQQQNYQLSQRVKQLLQQIQIYRDLLKQQNSQPTFTLKQSIPLALVQTNHLLDAEQVPFTITVSKNTNIYQNYENLQQENNELYDRIKELEQKVESYKELMRDGRGERDMGRQGNEMVESVEVQDMGEYQTGAKRARDVAMSQPPYQNNIKVTQSRRLPYQLENNSQQKVSQTTPTPNIQQQSNLINQTFKITLTKDKNIYKQQQQQNIQLSRRVIQLQEQIDKYKQLLKSQQDIKSSTNINPAATKENQQHYQGQGLTITLSKDKNIFENQQKEIEEYLQQVKRLQDIVGRYKAIYGDIDKEPEYKVSITREERIYEDQQQQIKSLLKALHQKDDQVMELTTRLSWLQRHLQFNNEQTMKINNNSDQAFGGEFKINIHRDENIYNEQEKDIRQLSERIREFEQKLTARNEEISEKETIIDKMKKQLAQIKITNTTITPNTSHLLPIKSHSLTPTPSQSTSPILSCLSCISMQKRLLQLQTTIQLLQQQKTMLEQQLGVLQQQKFCFTSTQNELKITIEDLRDEINLLGQENERLVEEFEFFQRSCQQMERERERVEGNDRNSLAQGQEEVVNRQNFALSLPQNMLSQYKQTHPQLQASHKPTTKTHHLQQQPQSPRSKHSKTLQSPSASKLLSLQQQNTHLRQSLTTFQQQLQQQYLTIGELQQRIARLMHQKQILFERDQQLSKEIILLSKKEQQVNQRQLKFRQRILQLEKEVTSMKTQSLSTINTSHVTRRDEIELGNTNRHSNKHKITELQKQVQELRAQSKHLKQTNSHQSQQLILSRQQLSQKHQQIQQLQTELQSWNQSLTQLSLSYQSLQRNILELQEQKYQKESQVQSIRQEYESMNRLLKEELQSIESIIIEKQRICEENVQILKEREERTAELEKELQRMRSGNNQQLKELSDEVAIITRKLKQVESLKEELIHENGDMKKANLDLINQTAELTHQISTLKQQLTQFHSIKPQTPLTSQQLTFKKHLLTILQQLKHSKHQHDTQLHQLLPLIQQKLNQAEFPTVIHGEQQLARLISKQVQKIKINIMRNYQVCSSVGGSQGVIQKTVPIKAGYNQDFKTFAEKSAMLNYLKSIEDLIKGY